MDHIRTFATGLSSLSVPALQTFVRQNLMVSSLVFYVLLLAIIWIMLRALLPREKPTVTAPPVHLSERESMFPPGMQIENAIKKWVSSGMGGASGVAGKGRQKQH
jgi:hypothetical protein